MYSSIFAAGSGAACAGACARAGARFETIRQAKSRAARVARRELARIVARRELSVRGFSEKFIRPPVVMVAVTNTAFDFRSPLIKRASVPLLNGGAGFFVARREILTFPRRL